ncbi:MAG: uroporphyrinogen-III C-methyltransferase [bacterium]
MSKTGKVYLVGAGPGEPELITIKGKKCLQGADIIIYDYLVNGEFLKSARPQAEKICTASLGGKHYSDGFIVAQKKINQLMIRSAREGKIICRLKNGDPFIFGRGGQEIEALNNAGIPYEVIPGITAAQAVAASLNIPLTDRRYASLVTLIAGHEANRKTSFIAWKSIPRQGTLVFYMGMENLPRIITRLKKAGLKNDMPVAIVEKATLPGQRVVMGNLKDIVGKAKKEKFEPPAVILVGEVVSLRRPKILVTGTNPKKFESLGEIIHQPMIKIVPLDNYRETDQKIQDIKKYHWVIFLSVHGVEFFFKRFKKNIKDMKALRGIKICAVGSATGKRLKKYGITVNFIPEKESSTGIVEAFRNFDIRGKNILIPRSNLAGNYLSKALEDLGANVDTITVYRNIKPKVSKINLDDIEEIIFTSPSTVNNFMKEYKKLPRRVKVKCIGEITQAQAKSYGLNAKVI